MKAPTLTRYSFGAAACVALMAGCSANVTTPSLGGSSVAPRHPLTHSWFKKPPKGMTGTLWADDIEYGTVDRIAYPSGTLIGQVSGFSFPYGNCSDKKGNVYVADAGADTLYEINSSGSVIDSWPTGGYTSGCSVAPNGDVAATNFTPGGVKIVAGPDAGTSYPGPAYDWPAGYDAHGNLFVECNYASPCSSPSLAEVPAGSKSWIVLNLNKTIYFAGAVQNMGKYLGAADQDVGGQNMAGIDLVDVSGSNATVVKTIVLHGCGNYLDFAASWASITNKPNGVVTTKVKDIGVPSNGCAPNAIAIFKAKNGDFFKSIGPTYQYDYGVTFTKP